MKRVIVDENISVHSKELIRSLGYDLIETVELTSIQNCTSTHPDMQFLKIGEKKALVAQQTLSYYRQILTDFKLIPIDNIGGEYPDDCMLNAVLYKNLFISTKIQYGVISDYIDKTPIFVSQGYTKCSTCILNDNSIITADEGITLKCKINGIRTFVLPDDEIVLSGYKNGFWGGSTGLLNEKQMFFNGNIELLSCYPTLKEILEKEKIEPIYHKHTPLTDNGSILSIDI